LKYTFPYLLTLFLSSAVIYLRLEFPNLISINLLFTYFIFLTLLVSLVFSPIVGIITTLFIDSIAYLSPILAPNLPPLLTLELTLLYLAFGIVSTLLIASKQRHLLQTSDKAKHFHKLAEESIHPIFLKNNQGHIIYASN